VNALQLRAIASGILFGIWPLFDESHRSLRRNFRGGFGLGQAFIVLPFAVYEIQRRGARPGLSIGKQLRHFYRRRLLGAGSGLLLFNGALAKATKEEVARWLSSC